MLKTKSRTTTSRQRCFWLACSRECACEFPADAKKRLAHGRRTHTTDMRGVFVAGETRVHSFSRDATDRNRVHAVCAANTRVRRKRHTPKPPSGAYNEYKRIDPSLKSVFEMISPTSRDNRLSRNVIGAPGRLIEFQRVSRLFARPIFDDINFNNRHRRRTKRSRIDRTKSKLAPGENGRSKLQTTFFFRFIATCAIPTATRGFQTVETFDNTFCARSTGRHGKFNNAQ